jgi:hypothetical protein
LQKLIIVYISPLGYALEAFKVMEEFELIDDFDSCYKTMLAKQEKEMF